MIWSIVALAIGVLAYGISGARLHTGAQHEGGALRSASWWIGTAMQGVGFFMTLFARQFLPLLIVQATSTSALAVTAIIQHLQQVRRLAWPDWSAIAGVCAGIALLATATQTGAAPTIRTVHVVVLWALAAVCIAALAVRPSAAFSGLMSGLGFSLSAIGARLLIGDHDHPLWFFWRLPLENWILGFAVVAGIVLGQVHVTRGLKGAHAAPVLGCMYLMTTLVPAAVGWLVLGEHTRPGSGPQVTGGLLLALAGSLWLLRTEDAAGQADQADRHI